MSKKSIASDLTKLDRVKDADIDYSDIPPLDKSLFAKATAWPTRINRILRAVMEGQPSRFK